MRQDKLVRDKIPEIIRSVGKKAKTRIIRKEDFENELILKLQEETGEYLTNKKQEELADILELFYTLLKLRDYSFWEIDELRRKKRDERGSFEKRIFLEEVND